MPDTSPAIAVTPYLTCRDAHAAVEFYHKAFGAETVCLMPTPDGRVMHASLNIGGAAVFLSDEFPEYCGKSPQALGGSPVILHLQVPDCDALFARAVDAGCEVKMAPEDMFWGDRYAAVTDPYGHRWGFATTIQKPALSVSRPTDREIVLSHTFDAPRDRVFAALTSPEAMKHWLGPYDWSLAECEVDLRAGGSWRFLMRGPDGGEFGLHGVYREVEAPERFVHTETYDSQPAFGELLVTTVLAEVDGRTTVTVTLLHPTQEARDANSHLEQGMAQSYDKLAAYLAWSAS